MTFTQNARGKYGIMGEAMKNPFRGLHFKTFLFTFILFIALFAFFTILFGNNEEDAKNHTNSTHLSSSQNGIKKEYVYIEGNADSENKILLVNIQGLILTEKIGDLGFFDLLGEDAISYGYDIRRTFYSAAKDPTIKGIFLQINSPGGTIGGAEAISNGIEYYRQTTKNPVYTHIVDQGTSGAYWAAASTDRINAEVGSLIGSIGVIMGPFKYYDGVIAEGDFVGSVQTEGGIENRFFTAGEYKDTGSPYRPLTEEEEEHWQTSLNNEYEQFVSHVSKTRDIEPEIIIDRIKAFPYGTEQAKRLGLIDSIGSDTQVLRDLLSDLNISRNDYQLIAEEERIGFFDNLFSSISYLNKPQANTTACPWCGKPLLLYDPSYKILPPQ